MIKMKEIERLLNRITMYKLILWGLRILFGISWLFSVLGILPYGAIRPLVSISILIGVCYAANYFFAKHYKVAANSESTNITALLLYFIFQPPKDVHDAILLAFAGFVAIVCKYKIVKNERHLVNPAAFGALAVGIVGLLHSRWWVGSDSMFIFVLVFGFLIVKKIHRFPMVSSFMATAVLLSVFRNNAGFALGFRDAFLSFPIVFFGTLMLTEPVTTPPRRYQQIGYGVLVGVLFSSGLRIGSVSMTPELALVIGNLAVYFVASRGRQPLKFEAIDEIGKSIYQYTFKPKVPLDYKPGQYIELTLPLEKTDFRGNRRTFTIASSPTENKIMFGIKQVPPVSSFKAALFGTKHGAVITANNVAGDFLLPLNDRVRMVFIAGGIGITPFRSMLKYLTDVRQSRNITLFYAVSDPKQIVYKDVLNDAKEYGLKVVYVLTLPPGESAPASWKGEVGVINMEMIAKHVLDYRDRQFYISGPDGMVQANKRLLRAMNIPRNQIVTDYFAGY